MASLKVNPGSSYVPIKTAGVFVGSSFKPVKKISANVGGVWRVIWENTYKILIASNQENYVLSDHIPASVTAKNIEVTIANGISVFSRTTSKPGFNVGSITGKTITIINNGFILGAGGAQGAVGGVAFYTRVAVTLDNKNEIFGGGGGGGKGGKGGSGIYTANQTRHYRLPSKGEDYKDRYNGDWEHNIQNNRFTVQLATAVATGNNDVYFHNHSSGNPSHISSVKVKKGKATLTAVLHRGHQNYSGGFMVNYAVWADVTEVKPVSHTSSGGAGGSGGHGRSAIPPVFNLKGNAGTVGKHNSGRGGAGGNGGDWGLPGQNGHVGIKGNHGNGLAGQHGGAAGRSIDGDSHITWVTVGTLKGAKAN